MDGRRAQVRSQRTWQKAAVAAQRGRLAKIIEILSPARSLISISGTPLQHVAMGVRLYVQLNASVAA